MDFRTVVTIPHSSWQYEPCEKVLFVGSCFAEHIGRRFTQEKFRTLINPFGVMYNPVSVGHTIERLSSAQAVDDPSLSAFSLSGHNTDPVGKVVITLGTNHVYILKETGEVVDNCQKRPASLFEEKKLSVEECAETLSAIVRRLTDSNPQIRILLTVSPIRYAKYGYHESNLSKATLLLACQQVAEQNPDHVTYFPAYEIMNDELRDYRFYAADMLHPSDQAVEYIWERLSEQFFSTATQQFLQEWRPIRQALNHRPFNPDSDDYLAFLQKTRQRVEQLSQKYPAFSLSEEENKRLERNTI